MEGDVPGVAIVVRIREAGGLCFVLSGFFFSPHGIAGDGVETLRFGGVDALEGRATWCF